MESKFYKKDNKNNYNTLNLIKKYINKILITIIITLILLIAFKVNVNFKSVFNKYVYNTYLPFSDIKKVYDEYFLGKDNKEVVSVFNEKINYSDLNMYEDGVKLTVKKNEFINALESGVVVYVGDKDKYGNTVIVQQVNGVDVFYGNIKSNVKMYDYIEKGSLIGESLNNNIYLVFQKEGKFVPYKEYLK